MCASAVMVGQYDPVLRKSFIGYCMNGKVCPDARKLEESVNLFICILGMLSV